MNNKLTAIMWEQTAKARLTAQTPNAAKRIKFLYGAIDCGQMSAESAEREFTVILSIELLLTGKTGKAYNLASQYKLWIGEAANDSEYSQTINEAYNVLDRACALAK
jgi:hypothetical protein